MIASAKLAVLAFTVPKISWFFNTASRMMVSVSIETGPLRPGTPVKMKTPLVPSHEFSHVAVALIDASLGKFSGVAEVLAIGPASDTGGVRTRTPHGGNRQVAYLYPRDLWANFDHFS